MEEVQMLNTMDPSELVTTEDKIEVDEVIDYNDLKKEELVILLNQKDKDLSNYENRLEELTESHKQELDDMAAYYKNRVQQLNSIIGYYERKFKLIKDILVIEGGEKKND